MIHGGFRGNWNNGIVTEEYNDFYKAGYNLLFVDSRATGNSGGDYVTYRRWDRRPLLDKSRSSRAAISKDFTLWWFHGSSYDDVCISKRYSCQCQRNY